MSATAVATPTQAPKTFYCLRANYQACINPGESQLGPTGKVVRFGEKHLSFVPTSGPDHKTYGVLTTSDPERIAWMEQQIANGNEDFMTPAQFQVHTTPAEERAAAWESLAQESKRQLGHTNQLIEDLKQQNPDVYAKLMAKQKR